MKLRALLWFGAGLFVVYFGWFAVNLWGLGHAMLFVESPGESLKRHLLSTATYAVVSFAGGWLAERGWRCHGRIAIPGLVGMIVGMFALLLILATRAYEEGFMYDLTIPFGVLRALRQTFIQSFGGWEFVQLVAASGGGMAGGLLAGRGRDGTRDQ